MGTDHDDFGSTRPKIIVIYFGMTSVVNGCTFASGNARILANSSCHPMARLNLDPMSSLFKLYIRSKIEEHDCVVRGQHKRLPAFD